MTDTITVYRHGRFITEEAPEWFSKELDVAWDRVADITFGIEPGAIIRCWKLKHDHGHTAFMAVDEDHGEDVWIPTGADLADFLTTRAPAFISLGNNRPTAKSLQMLTDAFIAYARHGAGSSL